MQRLKVLVLCLMTVFALGAVAATVASASEPELLSAAGVKTKNETFEGHSAKTTGLGILENSLLVLCPETLTQGQQEGESGLGLFHLHFHKCTTNLGGTCTGLGDESGLILVLGTYHLVWDKLGVGTELGVGILFLIEHVHFVCKVGIVTNLILVLGDVLCLIKPINTLTRSYTIVCEKGAKDGDPGETMYWNNAGTLVEIPEGLLSSEDEGATYKMSSEEGEGTIETKNEVEIMG
jgi:hypothetical protein